MTRRPHIAAYGVLCLLGSASEAGTVGVAFPESTYRQCLPGGLGFQAFLGRQIGDCAAEGVRSFRLANRSDLPVQFRIRPDNGVWSTLVLEPDGADRVFCAGCSWFQFSMTTEGGKDVSYGLVPGERYAIFWNSGKRIWDLARQQPRRTAQTNRPFDR
jgi:hypothetical protein